MRCIGTLLGVGLLCGATMTHAGIFQTTVHSRANCLNNESITWWLNHPYLWRVVSVHKSPWNSMHDDSAGFDYNDRVAVVHWGEGMIAEPWEVWGYHYLYDFSRNIPFDTTYAIDCQFIEGW